MNPKDICKRLKLNNQIESILKEISINIENLKHNNINNNIKGDKEKIELIEKKFYLLNIKFNNIEVKTNIMNENPLMIDTKEKEPGSSEILRNGEDNNSSEENERPIYEEELKIIDEFKLSVIKQDKELNKLKLGVDKLKDMAIEIGEQIKGTGLQINNTTPKAVIIVDNVKSKTEMVNDLIKEIRKPSKICCDICLIILLFGLICVLISIIRRKFF